MTAPRTGIQLFTLRELDHPLSDVLSCVDETSLTGVEFVEWEHELLERDAAELEATMSALDIAGPSVLIDIEPLEESLNEVIETYAPLGCESFVVGWLHPQNFKSESAVHETATRLSTIAERCADRGVELHYHNHDHEFVDLGETTAYELLTEAVDDEVGFELDIAWASAAGFDPASLIERLAPTLLHLKDVALPEEQLVELGAGDVPLGDCVAAAEQAGTEWIFYEYDSPTDPYESLEHGSKTLRSLTENI